MSDFTGFGMQDQFRAIVAARAEIAGASWRRKWKELRATDAEQQCCSADERSLDTQHVIPQQALTPHG